MMNCFKTVLVALLFCLISPALLAQDKTQAYYNTHESEILPDARAAFRKGDYERTVELCKWHYIIVGSQDATSLRERAEQCAKLSKEMTDFFSVGKKEDARKAANSLLIINANDTKAKELLEELDKPEVPVPVDTVEVSKPKGAEVKVETPPVKEQEIDVFQEPVIPVIQEQKTEPVSDNQNTVNVQPVESPRTRFVVKAGAAVLDTKQLAQTIAPGGSLGIYDLGGSPIGLEAGLYLCPGLSSKSASLFGLDASMVFRVANGIYPKAGVGFFSCKSSSTGTGTNGLCAGLGLTLLVGGHFCVEFGAKYFPKVNVSGTETVSTAGASYEFPIAVQILSGGIAPMVSIGWAF